MGASRSGAAVVVTARGADGAEVFLTLRYEPSAVVHYRHRRGMRSMLQQHYLYGKGMAQVLARVGVPGESGGRGVLGSMRPNAQRVDSWSVPHVLRKLALGAGRAVGTLQERTRRTG